MEFFDEYEQFYYEEPTPEELEREELENCLYNIKKLDNWVCYRIEPRKNGKKGKIPINPYTGENASATNPNTWGSYEDARDASKKYDGIGFQFGTEFQGYVGVDLDDVVQEDGVIKQFAIEIVKLLNSYTEYSPSGKGLHIICQSDSAMENWGYGASVSHRDDKIGLEMYDSQRFFTITGKMYNVSAIWKRTEELKQVYEKYLNKKSNPSSSTEIQTYPTTHNYEVNNLDDKELWNKMFNSQNGEKIRSLFNGDISAYDNDDSRADLALCSYLAYWTNKDAVRMDKMFRQSKLMREKWTQGSNPTYGERTIQAAIGQNISLQQTLNVIPQELPPISTPLVIANSEDVSVADYLDNLFDEDVNNFNRTSALKTGFNNIDAVTSLYSGLYLIGAVPGLGKTTFATQLADNLSSIGKHVLFFSLEQKRMELVSKGISRLTVSKNIGLTAIQVRERGKSDYLVAKAIMQYKTFSQNEHFISCGFANFDFIKNKVQNYIKEKQVRPIVIIDYLQIIQPSNSTKNTTKDIIDNHVRELKKLQVDNDIVLILISSLNRSNYLTPIDYESFKETGSLEYTADVIWGLQLQIMNDEIFSDKKSTISEKRDKINNAKSQLPRKLELVCIKNRFGCNYSCQFDYYAQYDLFKAPNVQNKIVKTIPEQTVARV